MTAKLRITPGKTIVAPGASDALSARLIEAHGYECVLSLDQLAEHAAST